MNKLCTDLWTKTPAISCRYQFCTAIQKTPQDKSNLAAMTSEGRITLPLIVVAGIVLMVTVPCICCLCRKKKKAKKAD